MSAENVIKELDKTVELLEPYKGLGGAQLEEVLKDIENVKAKLKDLTAENVTTAKEKIRELYEMFDQYRSYVPDVADAMEAAKNEIEKM